MSLAKFNLCASLLFLLFFSGCASKRPMIIMHPSRQQTPAPQPVPIKPHHAAMVPNVPQVPPPPPIMDNASTKITPLKPAEPVNNLTELKKNADNSKIATDLIENKLSAQELESAANDSSFAVLKPQLLLKIGKNYQKNNDDEKAAEYFRSITTLHPKAPQAAQAAVLLSSIQLADEVDAKVIGAILPLTGKNASIGQHALNALRMGLEINKTDTKFRIALFDSQSNPDQAIKGVDKLVKEDKAIVILGGFTSKEAVSIASRAELLAVPYIGFSQKSGLTNVGEYVFRNSITPEMQVDKITQFATEKLSAKKFAILFPNDSYGVEFSNIFWDHVLARGGEITAAQTYDPKETDFSEVIQKLVGTYYTEARSEEYKKRVREMKAKKADANKKGSSRDHWSEENVLPPIVDFDAIFVPDNSRALGQILAFMKYNDVTDMNYLGTNIWNSPDLPKRASNEDAGLYFVDAIDISQGATQTSTFFKDYLAQFNEEPTIVEIQVYEAAKIVKDQISSGASSREVLASRLRSLGRSPGVTGELRMSSQRELERPIHVLTLDSGLVKKVE
ncbi:penicillin-binding protein activator [bacterium]|nr:penicillin-binding protein activator [bacterium]